MLPLNARESSHTAQVKSRSILLWRISFDVRRTSQDSRQHFQMLGISGTCRCLLDYRIFDLGTLVYFFDRATP